MVGFFWYFGSPRQKGVLGADTQGFTVWRLWKDTFFRTQLFGLQQFIVFKSFWRSFSFHSMNAPGLRTRFFFWGLADVFKIISTAYPETLSKMIIVNPPAGDLADLGRGGWKLRKLRAAGSWGLTWMCWGFNMLWMAVQPMLNQRIKQRLETIFSARDVGWEVSYL